MRRLIAIIHALYVRADASLRARILIPTAVLFAATLAAMVFAATEIRRVEIDRMAKDRTELAANLVAGGVEQAVASGAAEQVPELLATLQKHRADIDWVSLLDGHGVVRFSTRDDLVGTRPWGDALLVEGTTPAPDAPLQFAALRPLAVDACAWCPDGERVVWLDLRFSRVPQREITLELARTLGLTAAPSLLLLLAIAWWLLGREAVGPLNRLVAAMRRAEAGELDVRSDEGRPDELGKAARGFDSALGALGKSQAELQALYQAGMARADRFALVGEMATGLAHEIKNPLAGLSGALDVLAEDLAADARHADVVAEMQSQVRRLAGIMDGLLGFARPPRVRLQEASVNLIVEKVLFLVEKQNRGRVRVVRDLGARLPPAFVDPGQLEQVLLNLCLNACQAVGGKGELRVRTALEDGELRVEVADSGPGIPPEVRDYVFQPFFTTRKDGNGLGLAISERIVANHGGRIWFTCPPGGGTRFTVALPAQLAMFEEAA